jgi:polyhydroxyalkanoate synthesis repressor PhaR
MAESPPATNDTVPQHPPVVVKKYANRRLYNTETSSYITLENLADMVRLGRDFVVYDAKSSEDITRTVLTQIIVEEESKGTSMLPTNFLRQLIGFYGDSLQGVVPRYLESAMSNFARQQQQMRQVMQQTFSPFLPMGVEEMGRQNIALMERAMSMLNPFVRPGEPPKPAEPSAAAPETATAAPEPVAQPEVDALRHEVEALRTQLAIARAESVIAQHMPPSQAAETAPTVMPDPTSQAAATPRKAKVTRKPN